MPKTPPAWLLTSARYLVKLDGEKALTPHARKIIEGFLELYETEGAKLPCYPTLQEVQMANGETRRWQK